MNTTVPFNPFPGLRPFREQDDRLFFGRDSQVDELVERLRRTRFVAVVGTSGSGKSSLVRAGLIPALHGGYMASTQSPNWRIAIMRPGNDPIANLASALLKTDGENAIGTDPEERIRVGLTRAVLRSSALGLAEVVLQGGERQANMLVIVDQFEELFRFERAARRSPTGDEAAAFVRLLSNAAAQTDARIYVLLTMRSDFLGDCARFQDLPEALNKGLFLVPRLTRDQLREAIEGPVAVAGATITPRLVNALLEDVGDDPNQLPPLQHSLMRTFDIWTRSKESAGPIDVQHYEETGKIGNALSIHGDSIFAKCANYEPSTDHPYRASSSQVVGRKLVERLFKTLTERGSDGRRVRRPISVARCLNETGATKSALMEVVAEFRERQTSFLMPPPEEELDDETILDITHESLMENWARLRNWVDEEAESAQQYKRLAAAAELHANRQAALWRNPELKAALRWKKKQKPTPGWADRYDSRLKRNLLFLKASQAERLSGRIARISLMSYAVVLSLYFVAYYLTSPTSHAVHIMVIVAGAASLLLFAAAFAYFLVLLRMLWLVRKLQVNQRVATTFGESPVSVSRGDYTELQRPASANGAPAAPDEDRSARR
jgi:energy-coupling factor transporter ATP-binding protein EcfA2